MTRFTVYQPILTDRMANLVNEKGWDGSDLAKGYARVTMGNFGAPSPDLENHIKELAAAYGVYRKTMEITCPHITQVFEIGNIGPEESITRHGPVQKSVSVGDVIIDHDEDTAWLCDSHGWTQLFTSTRIAVVASGENPAPMAA